MNKHIINNNIVKRDLRQLNKVSIPDQQSTITMSTILITMSTILINCIAINANTGKMWFGAGYNMEKLIIPATAKTDDGRIKCRKCEEYKLSIDAGGSMRSMGKCVGKMRRHESACGKKAGERGLMNGDFSDDCFSGGESEVSADSNACRPV